MCDDIPEWERDLGKILLFTDAVILCVSMISEALKTLANGDYWCYCHQHELDNPEVLEVIDYIDRERSIHLLNYDFVEEYRHLQCDVLTDEVSGMKFVPYKNRKMFFPKGWEDERIRDYFRSVVMEQDERSPHCYRQEGYYVREGDVVVDAGAAEGIWALDIIDVVGKIYLIEADEHWVEALRQTFREDTDKVQIIYGFLDNVMEGQRVSIDGLFDNEEIHYIKMDIEGYEKQALMGAVQTINKNQNIRCAICAYHCKEDETWIRNWFQTYGLDIENSKGYICPDWSVSGYLEAELRRGVLFGRKGD